MKRTVDIDAIDALLGQGFGSREIGRRLKINAKTVAKRAATHRDLKCGCGRPWTHPSRCDFRRFNSTDHEEVILAPACFPHQDIVARAIIEACKVEGEDPVAVAAGRNRSRARTYAFIALAFHFPRTAQKTLMRLCGASRGMESVLTDNALAMARGRRGKAGEWFSIENLNRVVVACGWPPMTAEDAKVKRMPAREKPEPLASWGATPDEVVDLPSLPRATKPSVKPDPKSAPKPPPKIDPAVISLAANKIMNRGSEISTPQPQVRRRPAVPKHVLELEQRIQPMPRTSSTIVSTMPGEFSVSYKPDRPLVARRDVEIMTADVFGDPAPGRSALDQKRMGR
jgi:hypothetical protein